MDPIIILILAMFVVVFGIMKLRLPAFIALLLGGLSVGLLSGATGGGTGDFVPVGKSLALHFGSSCGKVGILIAMAAVIGRGLMNSGAAESIVRALLWFVGEKLAPMAFLICGFVLGVPVYFDTVFYLLIPLGRALGSKNKRNYGLYVMSMIAGGTMAHSLVPPTPGPLLVTEAFNISFLTMMIAGFLLGMITSTSGFFYAYWLNKRSPLPFREDQESSEPKATQPEGPLPGLWISMMPIVTPIVLIALATWTGYETKDKEVLSSLEKWVLLFGEKNMALTVGAILALGLLARQKKANGIPLGEAIEKAISSAAMIILITSAGGAFGGMLQDTGIAGRVSELAGHWNMGILPLAFIVTTLVRTAQGSATVAMITAAGIFKGFVVEGTLEFHPVYLALAIGCGSKPFPWMNDSGFWVVSKLSGMTPGETIRCFSVLLTVMGLTGLLIVMIAAALFPMK